MTAIAVKPTEPAEAVTVEEARTTAVVAAEAKRTVVRRPPAAPLPWPRQEDWNRQPRRVGRETRGGAGPRQQSP